MAPTKSAPPRKRFFTVEEANRALPLVRRIVEDIVRQWEVVNQLQQRLSVVEQRGSRKPLGDLYDEEVERSRSDLKSEEQVLDTYLQELKSIGVQLQGPDGLCDFPSLRDGREICLCWRRGEPTVAYWHDKNSSVGTRVPLGEDGSVTSR